MVDDYDKIASSHRTIHIGDFSGGTAIRLMRYYYSESSFTDRALPHRSVSRAIRGRGDTVFCYGCEDCDPHKVCHTSSSIMRRPEE